MVDPLSRDEANLSSCKGGPWSKLVVLVLKNRSNSDRADNEKNGVKGKCLNDVKNKEFSRGRYICIILCSHVCSSTCFKPIQLHGEISPRFGTDLYITEIYKRTILISQCSFFFFSKGACMYALLRLSSFELF